MIWKSVYSNKKWYMILQELRKYPVYQIHIVRSYPRKWYEIWVPNTEVSTYQI